MTVLFIFGLYLIPFLSFFYYLLLLVIIKSNNAIMNVMKNAFATSINIAFLRHSRLTFIRKNGFIFLGIIPLVRDMYDYG